MEAYPQLWKHYTRKDGTNRVVIYASGNGANRYYKTGINIHPTQWDPSRGVVVGHPKATMYNIRLSAKVSELLSLMEEGVAGDQLEKVTVKSKSNSLTDFFARYITELKAGIHGKKAPGTIKNYQSALTKLTAYENERGTIRWESIDMDFYRSYHQFLINNDSGSAAFGTHIKRLKRVMREAFDRKLHTNDIFKDSRFRAIRPVTTGKTFLTKEEIEKIERVDLTTMPHLAFERDRFLIQYYFVMRWEDSVLISKQQFRREDKGLNYIYTSRKTSVRCVVPVSQKAKEILESRGYCLEGDTNQEANRKIKTICQLAGINTIVTLGKKTGPKYRFVTTHTARRSAATNLYLEGASLMTIAGIGGWKNIQTLRTYLLASGIEIANMARNLDFFR